MQDILYLRDIILFIPAVSSRHVFFKALRGLTITEDRDVIIYLMRKISHVTVLVVFVLSGCCFSNGSEPIPKQKRERMEGFIRNTVVQTLKKTYHDHDIYIDVIVTNLKIDKVNTEETDEYIFYNTQGRVSYVIKGERAWKDKEGNLIQLDPEQEITHWFSCGIREDRYGELLNDDRNRLTFYFDNQIRD